MEINMSLLELTAVELAKEIKAGKTTAVEAMKAVLEQIEKTEETYHCYITIDKEKAMQKQGKGDVLIKKELENI